MLRSLKFLTSTSLALILMNGCSDERVTQIAREAADRQAQQSTAMAELNKEVAGGTKRLVEADTQARKEFVGVHREMQAERTRLGAGWDALEQERKQLATQRRTESMLLPVMTLVGGALVASLALGFSWYALVAANRGDGTDAELKELLISEILPAEPPRLASGRPVPTLLAQSDEKSAE